MQARQGAAITKMSRRFRIGLVLLLSIYAMGGIGYKFFSPETPFIDCLYMSVITLPSVLPRSSAESDGLAFACT